MTIEIRQPELESLIHERMASGRFQTIEDVLLQALRTLRLDVAPDLDDETGMRLIAAMQASPYKEVDLEPARYAMPVRDVVL